MWNRIRKVRPSRSARVPLSTAVEFALAAAFVSAVWFLHSSHAAERERRPLERLRLEPAVADARSREATPWRTLEVGRGLEALRVEGGARAELAADDWGFGDAGSGDSARLWRIELDRETTLRCRGRFEAGQCQRWIIRAAADQDVYVHGRFERDGHPLAGSLKNQRIAGSSTRDFQDSAVLDLPGLLACAEDPDELVLELSAPQGTVLWLRSIELQRRPLEAWFPAPYGPSALIAVGDESRRAWGLSNRDPLIARFDARRGEKLECAAAVPDEFARPDTEPELEVELRADSLERTERVSLAVPEGGVARWRELAIPLDEFAGHRVVATFRLKAKARMIECFCALAEPTLVRPNVRAPTVLLITSDTHRCDHVRAFAGSVAVETPNLDELAARGVSFEDCLSLSNVTNPSHISIMTGASPRDVGIVDNFTPLNDSAVTLAQRFREAGWATWAVVSADHLADPLSGLGHGFDRMNAPQAKERDADHSIDALEEWLARAGERPTFVWLHVFDAHAPYEPAIEFERLYWPAEGPRTLALDERIPPRSAEYLRDGERDPELLRARYRGEVSELDAKLARVLGDPRLARGVIAFTADHGESLGEHAIYWDHAGLYPQTTHVPLILAWPGGPQGRHELRSVSHSDLARTLLDLAGLADAPFEGVDLAQDLGDAQAARPRFMLSSHGFRAAVRDGSWLMVMTLRPSWVWVDGACEEPSEPHTVELYDVARDRDCLDDRADALPERVQELRRELIAWLTAARPRGWAGASSHDAQRIQHLKELGYTTAVDPANSTWFDPDCECAACRRFGS